MTEILCLGWDLRWSGEIEQGREKCLLCYISPLTKTPDTALVPGTLALSGAPLIPGAISKALSWQLLTPSHTTDSAPGFVPKAIIYFSDT